MSGCFLIARRCCSIENRTARQSSGNFETSTENFSITLLVLRLSITPSCWWPSPIALIDSTNVDWGDSRRWAQKWKNIPFTLKNHVCLFSFSSRYKEHRSKLRKNFLLLFVTVNDLYVNLMGHLPLRVFSLSLRAFLRNYLLARLICSLIDMICENICFWNFFLLSYNIDGDR